MVVLSRERDNKEDGSSDEDDEEIIVGTENEENSVAQETASEASTSTTNISRLEVAACDGPVQFRRVANPFTAKVPMEESSSTSQGGTSDVTYQCLFCNHIFKSHYCYQKHKRRHLNPFLADFHRVIHNKNGALVAF